MAIITIFTDFDVHLTTTSRSARRSERTLLPRTWAVAGFRGTLEMLSNTVSACSMHSSRKAISLPIAPLSQFRQLKSQVQNRVRPTPRLEYFRKPDIAPLHSYIDTWFAPRHPRRCCAGEISVAFLERAASSPGKRKHHTHGDLSPTTALCERSPQFRVQRIAAGRTVLPDVILWATTVCFGGRS